MLRQPQGELAIRTRAACNEVLDRLRRCHRCRSGSEFSAAISSETSCDHCSSVLKATTPIGSLNCPDMRSAMMVSRSARLNLGFAVDATSSAEAVNYELGGLIRAVGHNP